MAYKFIAILMVLGLASFAVAQDLDAPTSGVPAGDNANAGADTSLYDYIMARMKANEAKFLESRNNADIHHLLWGIWRNGGAQRNGFGQNWSDVRMTRAEWEAAQAELVVARELWGQLTAAEYTAAMNESASSRERVLAAGLN